MKDLSNKIVIHVKKQNTEYLQFIKLLEYEDKITHAYSLGIDKNYRTVSKNGNMTEEERQKVERNYNELCKSIGANSLKVVGSNQFHTDKVECVESLKSFYQENIEVDGICTNKKEIILSTINADCILLLFYDPVKNVIANTHSGWRGTLQRISVKTVEKMKEKYESNPKDIICCICPSIRKCHFEVEKDVKEMFEKEFKTLYNINEIIEEKVPNLKWNIDTVQINKIILQEVGLKTENIMDSQICSVCNKDIIHSFRVEKEGYGVETAIIGLK
jgi:YfiH family protein